MRWTYKLSDGVCRDSMALVTAKQYGISQDIIRRAEALRSALLLKYEQSRCLARPSPLPFTESSPQPPAQILEERKSDTLSSPSTGVPTRYEMERDILPILYSCLASTSDKDVLSGDGSSQRAAGIVVVEQGYNPPVSFEGHDCLYVLLVSNTKKEVPRRAMHCYYLLPLMPLVLRCRTWSMWVRRQESCSACRGIDRHSLEKP